MTKQEHLEDVLFRISKTSNRLSIYLDEAPVLLADLNEISDLEKKSGLEKKSDLEKKSAPEKNSVSDFAQCVRMDWIDEIIPIMLDDDEFSLTSLLKAIAVSIEAMNQLLDITKEKIALLNSKTPTCREKAEDEHPWAIGKNYAGGVYLCPYYYGYSKIRFCSPGCDKPTVSEELCTACWDQPVQPKSV